MIVLRKQVYHFAIQCLLAIVMLVSVACSSTKYVPQDNTLLTKVSLTTNREAIKVKQYRQYVRQEPNVSWGGFGRVPLGIYNASGNDSTRWLNRVLRRIGEAPVIYNEELTQQSADYIKLALRNKGYLSAEVSFDTITSKKRHTEVAYHLQPGYIYTIRELHVAYADSSLTPQIDSIKGHSLLYEGMPLSTTLLEAERSRIVSHLRNKGYYYYHKDLISFVADSMFREKGVALTMRFAAGKDSSRTHQRYRLGDVRVFVGVSEDEAIDSIRYRNRTYYYKAGTGLPLSYEVLHRSIYFDAGDYYEERLVTNSYRSLGALPIVKASALRFVDLNDRALLRADVYVQLNKPNAITAELEGTNTAGDLGAAASIAYTHKNLLKGGERLTLKLRGAYEAIGKIDGYEASDYVEFNGEATLKFPTLLAPFFNTEQRHIVASSEITAAYSMQNRPEFRRRVTTGGWRYYWTRHNSRWRHTYDLLSLNYVSMPWVSETFRKIYLEQANNYNSLMRYSYDNLFIMSSSYGFTLHSRANNTSESYRHSDYQVKGKVETAGNLLQVYSQLVNTKRNALGQHEVFGVAYSQYVKFDLDYVKHFAINERNSLVFHLAVGVSVPYGNAKIVPYEKRYFAGGANSVRGWSARELGPGEYRPNDGVVNYIMQTGNIKLDLNLEHRTHLWGKLHGAAFVDAGNVWTIRDYQDQAKGLFRPTHFYRQIAVSYGLGLRFDLGYFVLRFDGGMKAINPIGQVSKERYPIISPRLSRDFTLHFAVGYPF
ncbi:MAG: BamA/TamA family outer membrane protein [Bacteroidales bacterium]|nr:BamA/TamA family outer membrane protein [Bacteroidales bacterium]